MGGEVCSWGLSAIDTSEADRIKQPSWTATGRSTAGWMNHAQNGKFTQEKQGRHSRSLDVLKKAGFKQKKKNKSGPPQLCNYISKVLLAFCDFAISINV